MKAIDHHLKILLMKIKNTIINFIQEDGLTNIDKDIYEKILEIWPNSKEDYITQIFENDIRNEINKIIKKEENVIIDLTGSSKTSLINFLLTNKKQ